MSSLAMSGLDYLIFAAMLIFSALIGVYFGCFGTKQRTIKEYLLAGKKMTIIPIAVSVAISHISGSALVVFPAEVYRYGASVWLAGFSLVIMCCLSVFVYLPVFFKLQVSNVYEYLERRFDKKTRMLALVIYILSEILIFPIHAYTPSLVFATVSGFNVSWAAFVISCICVFYTAIGGLRTVVWTDFLQFGVIIISLVIVYISGINSSGGFSSMWNTALEGQRLDLFNFAYDLSARDGFWGYIFGCSAMAMASVGVHQTGVQKFLALPKYSDYIWSNVYYAISSLVVHTFSVLIGLGIYAKYKDCDPLTGGKMTKHDQLLPFYVADVAANVPGVCGLLVAAICSASLSSMSSNLNALSGVVHKYVVCVVLKRDTSEENASKDLKIIVLGIGMVCTCLVFAVDKLGELISLTTFVWGVTQGPLLGIFTLGVLFPRANSHGAFYGTFGGVIATSCLTVPAKYYQLKGSLRFPTKPLSTIGCDVMNQTLTSFNTTFSNAVLTSSSQTQVPAFFKLSFYFYTLFGAITTIIVGLVISYVTKIKSNALADKDLLSPVAQFWLPKQRKRDEISYSTVEHSLEILQPEDK